MKLGNFQDLLDKRFTKEELAEIEREVELELAALKALQKKDPQIFVFPLITVQRAIDLIP